MKALHLYLIAMTTALVACSSDEAVVPATADDDGGSVSFSSDVTPMVSRGQNTTTETLNTSGFWVKAYNATRGANQWGDSNSGMLHFTKESETSNEFVASAASDIDTRWPTGQTINFYASNLDPANYPLSGTTTPTYSFHPSLNIPEQFDFVYATNKGNRYNFDKASVPLNFRHALVQIEIKAKCSSDVYTVKVKGYRINYADLTYTFQFAEPTIVGTNADDDHLVANEPAGTWIQDVTHGYAIFNSGFYKGFTTTDNSISDTDADNYILLADTEQTIRKDDDTGLAMMLPWGNYSGYDSADLPGDNDGCYIGLLVQVDYKADNTPLYPACLVDPTNDATRLVNNLTTRVAYSGLPKYYGWIYTSLSINWKNMAGKKLTYVLDLSEGLGKIGPIKPAVVDPTAAGYDAATGTATAGSDAALDANRDPFSNKQQVMGDMGVTVTVGNWTDLTHTSENMTSFTTTSPTATP